jgi:hypothetical protein
MAKRYLRQRVIAHRRRRVCFCFRPRNHLTDLLGNKAREPHSIHKSTKKAHGSIAWRNTAHRRHNLQMALYLCKEQAFFGSRQKWVWLHDRYHVTTNRKKDAAEWQESLFSVHFFDISRWDLPSPFDPGLHKDSNKDGVWPVWPPQASHLAGYRWPPKPQ